MAFQIDTNRPVVYVEPNWMGKYKKNGNNEGVTSETPNKLIPLEDYCIYVDLHVEIPSRGMGTSEGSKSFVVEWTVNDHKNDITFMSGSKVYFKSNDKTKYVNSLTTNYTNDNLDDMKAGRQTNELFGIDSIEIKYNQYIVPEVTINFTDIRGAALFGMSQLSHQKTVNGIGGFRDEDVADSFFSCFFSCPYPKFQLIFKGYYGQPISYELNCSNFKARFDSQTGNFKAVANFIGFAYAFLNDVSFNALLSAPYADCGGIDYWKSRKEYVDDDFFVYGVDGSKVEIPTLAEVLVALDNIDEKIKAATSTSPEAQAAAEKIANAEDVQKLDDLNKKYFDAIKNVFKDDTYYSRLGDTDNGDDLVVLYGGILNSGTVGSKESTYTQIDTAKDAINATAKSAGLSEIYPSGSCQNQSIVKIFDSYDKSTHKVKMNSNFVNTVKANGGDVDKIKSQIEADIASHGGDSDNYYGFYFVNKYGRKKLGEKKEEESQTAEEAKKAEEEAKEAESALLAMILGFAPTVYNFVKILMAHLECFVWLMYNTATIIMDNPDDRTLENLNMTGDYQSDLNNSLKDANFVPPFPKITNTKVEGDGVKVEDNMNGTDTKKQTTVDLGDGTNLVIEEDWVGNISENFEEINLVNGILNGAKTVGEFMMTHADGMSGDTGNSNALNGKTGRECCVSNPISPLDTVLDKSSTGPWGSIDMSRYDDFAGKVFVRMSQVFAYLGNNTNGIETTLGTLDAKNFEEKHSTISGRVGDKIKGEHSFDEFKNIITGKSKAYQKEGKFAWEPSSKGTVALASESDGVYKLNVGSLSGGNIVMLVNNVSFDKVNKDLKPSNDNPPEYQLPSKYTNYGVFDDTNYKEKSNVQNINVFKIDYLGYADYEGYYEKIGGDDKKVKESIDKIFKGVKFEFDDFIKTWYDFNKFKSLCLKPDEEQQKKNDEAKKAEEAKKTEDSKKEGDKTKQDTQQQTTDNTTQQQTTSTNWINPDDIKDMAGVGSAKLATFPTVSIGGTKPSKDGCIFGSKMYTTMDRHGKAVALLLSASYVSKNSAYNCITNFASDLLADTNFYLAPRFVGLLAGAAIYYAYDTTDKLETNAYDYTKLAELGKKFKDVRLETRNALSKSFQLFASTDARLIDAKFGLKTTAKFQDLDDDITVENARENITNASFLGSKYKFGSKTDQDEEKVVKYNSGLDSLTLEFLPDTNTMPLIELMMQPCMYVKSARTLKSGKLSGKSYGVPEGQMKAYWNAFMTELGKSGTVTSAEGDKKGNKVETNTTRAVQSEAPEDVKVGVYHYCKTFYDKWMAGKGMDDFDDKWKLNNFFDPDDPRDGRFHFIDSFYNEVGQRILINPQILIEDIMSCISTNGLTLLSVLADMLGKNRFQLFCMQGFKDLMLEKNMRQMFDAIPFLEMESPNDTPDFVALYSYEQSSKADNEDSEYPNDSFMLDNEKNYPIAVKEKNLYYDYPLPAFGVSYGYQYQSYFSSIDVSMEKPQVTEQTIKTQYLLAGAGNDTTLIRKYVSFGQDLYSIFSNNAYCAEITMLGCAWVQPLMYFCLTNVPMFRGAYLISSVTHSITPNHMITKFKGYRMANTATRIGKRWIQHGYAPDEYYAAHTFSPYGGGSGGSGTTTTSNFSGQLGTLGHLSKNGCWFICGIEGWEGGDKNNPQAGCTAKGTAHKAATVGPGIDSSEAPEKQFSVGQHISFEEICRMFSWEINKISSKLDEPKNQSILKLPQTCIDMIISIAYNAGASKVKQYNQCTTVEQVAEKLANGPKTEKNKGVQPGLVARRGAEAAIARGEKTCTVNKYAPEKVKHYWECANPAVEAVTNCFFH